MFTNINRANNINYKIFYKNEIFKILEEVNWSELELSFERDLKYSGIGYNTTNTTIFIGETALFLKKIYDDDGIDAVAILNITDSNGKEIKSVAFDFYTFVFSEGKVSINLSDKGYLNLLQTNSDKDINIKNKTLTGEELTELEKKRLVLYSRGVNTVGKLVDDGTFLYKYLQEYNNNNNQPYYVHRVTKDNRNVNVRFSDTNDEYEIRGSLPFDLLKIESNDNNLSNQSSDLQFGANSGQDNYGNFVGYWDLSLPSVGNSFFQNDKDYSLNINLLAELKFIVKYKNLGYNPAIAQADFHKVKFDIKIKKYKFDFDENAQTPIQLIDEYIFKENIVDFAFLEEKVIDLSFKGSKSITVEKNEYLIFSYDVSVIAYRNPGYNWVYYTSPPYNSGGWQFEVKSIINGNEIDGLKPEYVKIKTQRISKQNITTHKVYTLKDLIYRYLNLIGIKNIKSDILEKGDLKNFIVANGFMLRNYPLDLKEHINKNINTSIKKALDSIINIFGLGYGIEFINNKQTFVIEKRNYFYNDEIVNLTDLSFDILEIKPEKQLYYNTIKCGYNKPTKGSYGSMFGLDEFNMDIDFGTNIKTKTNNATFKSNFRADSLGIEKVRVKEYKESSKEDTPYDDSIFIIDCKTINNNVFTPKLYKDLSLETPSGAVDIDGIYNLSITPKKILFNNLSFIKSCLKNSKITVLNNNSPINLIHYENGIKIEENSDIFINEAGRLFKAETIKLKLNLFSFDFIKNYKKLLNFGDGIIGYIKSIDYKDSTITILRK